MNFLVAKAWVVVAAERGAWSVLGDRSVVSGVGNPAGGRMPQVRIKDSDGSRRNSLGYRPGSHVSPFGGYSGGCNAPDGRVKFLVCEFFENFLYPRNPRVLSTNWPRNRGRTARKRRRGRGDTRFRGRVCRPWRLFKRGELGGGWVFRYVAKSIHDDRIPPRFLR